MSNNFADIKPVVRRPRVRHGERIRVGRALDLFGYDWPDMKRWGETIAKSRRKKSVK